jgi:hypothetical protein
MMRGTLADQPFNTIFFVLGCGYLVGRAMPSD